MSGNSAKKFCLDTGTKNGRYRILTVSMKPREGEQTFKSRVYWNETTGAASDVIYTITCGSEPEALAIHKELLLKYR